MLRSCKRVLGGGVGIEAHRWVRGQAVPEDRGDDGQLVFLLSLALHDGRYSQYLVQVAALIFYRLEHFRGYLGLQSAQHLVDYLVRIVPAILLYLVSVGEQVALK